jgi:sulfate adenylyltransferase subunit 2
MLYSIGKDSAVMLHLAMKAFYPSQASLPAAARRHDLEIPAMYEFRDRMAEKLGIDLLVHRNPDGTRAASIPSITARSTPTS